MSSKEPDVLSATSMEILLKNCRAKERFIVENRVFIRFLYSSDSFTVTTSVHSGASMNMTNKDDWIYDIRTPSKPAITVASIRSVLPAENKGKVFRNGTEDEEYREKKFIYTTTYLQSPVLLVLWL